MGTKRQMRDNLDPNRVSPVGPDGTGNERLRPELRLVLEFEPIAFASLAIRRASWQITPALVADAGEQ